MKTYKTIRVSQDTYEELLTYRAELEGINRQRISFDEAIDMLFGERAGLDHELTDEKLRFKKAHDACSCGGTKKFAQAEM